ncbi:MAG TPA: nuclear transport factor 2 family protein [Terriglobales bacterium]|nr:nuclear transport factor 2 family protein [Terriglobales bacterium]
MRKFVLTLLLIAALPAFAQTGSKSQSATDQQLIAKEKALWEAWKNKDAKPFEQETATNVPGVSPTGLVTTQQMTQEIQQCNVTSYSVEEPRVDWVGKDVAVVTYKANQDATCKGKKVPATVWAQSVWAQKDGKWVAVSHQEVPAGGGQSETAEKPE